MASGLDWVMKGDREGESGRGGREEDKRQSTRGYKCKLSEASVGMLNWKGST